MSNESKCPVMGGSDQRIAPKAVFPGDHGYGVMAMILFIWLFGNWRRGHVAALFLFPFVLPRIVSGAHWATDVTVGSLVQFLILLSLIYGTSFHLKPAAILAKKFDKVLEFLVLKLRLYAK